MNAKKYFAAVLVLLLGALVLTSAWGNGWTDKGGGLVEFDNDPNLDVISSATIAVAVKMASEETVTYLRKHPRKSVVFGRALRGARFVHFAEHPSMLPNKVLQFVFYSTMELTLWEPEHHRERDYTMILKTTAIFAKGSANYGQVKIENTIMDYFPNEEDVEEKLSIFFQGKVVGNS